MAKIIEFKTKKVIEDDEIKCAPVTHKSSKLFTNPEYKLSKYCNNPNVYELCHKCGACGRKFDNSGKLL